MNIVEQFNKKVKDKLLINNTFFDLDYERQGWVEQLISASYYNAKAVLDITKLPENLECQELYKIWVNALSELTSATFLSQEFNYGRLLR